jgi:hypothetical protein
MVSEIIGREEELTFLHSFVDDADRELAALVLEGEAGIGKSTLWAAGVEHARAERLRVLATRPVEAEHGFAHVGLADLFERGSSATCCPCCRRRGDGRSR